MKTTLILAALSLLAGACDMGFDPKPYCEQDPYLVAFDALEHKKYEITKCPEGMPMLYGGEGCVPCSYVDECGVYYYTIRGCSPAPGVYCWAGDVKCPMGFDLPKSDVVVQSTQE